MQLELGLLYFSWNGLSCEILAFNNNFLEEYVEVKEENIEIFEEINDRLIMEEKLEIKIMEEIDENPIIEKYLEVEMVEAIEDEDEEESFKGSR